MVNYSSKTTNFFQDVYDVVRMIPQGRVTSYGSITKYLGSRGTSRMVGWAINAAHALDDVPAHRVVNRQGILTGKNHFEHPFRMQELLISEGIHVENDKIVGFATVFWDVSMELAIKS